MSRQNNGDLIRLLLATGVLLMHAWQRSTGHLIQPIPFVGCFLALSGYLILGSRSRSSSAGHFIRKRIVRIWPALLCAFALTFVVNGQSVGTSVVTNTFMAHGPGGYSFWTITLEEILYLGLLATFAVGAYRSKWFALGGLVVSLGVACSSASWASPSWSYLLAIVPSFFAGNAIYQHGRLELKLALCLTALYPLTFLLPMWPQYAVGSVLLAYPLIYASFKAKQLIEIKNDLSYGVFLYHAPFLLWLEREFTGTPWVAVACLLGIAFPIAWLSWILVEKPALKLKDIRPHIHSKGLLPDTPLN